MEAKDCKAAEGQNKCAENPNFGKSLSSESSFTYANHALEIAAHLVFGCHDTQGV